MLQENIFFVSLIFVFLFDYFSFSAVFSSAPVSVHGPLCRGSGKETGGRRRTPGRPPHNRSECRGGKAPNTGPPSAGPAANATAAINRTPNPLRGPLQTPRRQGPEHRAALRTTAANAAAAINQTPSPLRGPSSARRRQFTAGKAPTAPARTPRWRRFQSRSPARQWRTASRTFR